MKVLIKSLLLKLGLALFGLVLALALIEILARTFHIGSGGFWEPHPLYGWRNIPGANGWESCYGECAVHVTINSQGLRDYEVSYGKASGTRRILFLGDSMTAAMQVPLEKTFAKILEKRLNSNVADERWEVVNGAVNGFGTDNELLFYRLEGLKYQPDLVIVGVYLANDIYNNHLVLELRTGGNGHKPYFMLTEDGELVLNNYPVEETDSISIRVGSFLKRYFQLPRFMAQVLHLRSEVPQIVRPLVNLIGGQRGVDAASAANSNTGQQQVRRGDICDESYTPEIEAAWDITRVLIRQLRTEVEATGAEFAVVMIPASPQLSPPADGVNWYCERPNNELSSFLEDESIPYLDLLGPFREHALTDGTSLYYSRDFHMNEAGNRLAGEQLDLFVRETLLRSEN